MPKVSAIRVTPVLIPSWGLGVSRQTTNAIETGRYDPSLPLAFAISRLFGLPIEEIFFPDDAQTTKTPGDQRS